MYDGTLSALYDPANRLVGGLVLGVTLYYPHSVIENGWAITVQNWL